MTATAPATAAAANAIAAELPNSVVKLIASAMLNKNNWKLATTSFETSSLCLANRVGVELANAVGGYEITSHSDGAYLVTSRGYYHYVGA